MEVSIAVITILSTMFLIVYIAVRESRTPLKMDLLSFSAYARRLLFLENPQWFSEREADPNSFWLSIKEEDGYASLRASQYKPEEDDCKIAAKTKMPFLQH